MENENTINEDVKSESTNEEGVKETSVDTDNTKTENNIPYSRFKDVNDKLKDATAKLDSYEAKMETARQKKMEEDGKLKELLAEKETEITSLKDKAEKLDKIEADRRESLISKLPDDLKEDEEFLSLSNNQIQKIVDKLETSSSAQVNSQQASRGVANAKPDLDKMSRSERRKNWTDIIKSYSN